MTGGSAEPDPVRSRGNLAARCRRISATTGLVTLGLISWLCYIAIGFSSRSLHESNPLGNGLLGLLALFWLAFGLYLLALRCAVMLPDGHRLLIILWSGAVLFRLTLLISDPIEEVDLYRYVWDGAVSTAGVSPFRYAPQQILATSVHDNTPQEFARLVRLKETSPELTAILRRVHFGELPTIYPPVSQVVFALCSWITPSDSSVVKRLTFMKAWFVVFDLLTVWLVLQLLRLTNRHRGWAIAYAWCPLAIKEIANSGHLDALAICLTTLAMIWVVRALQSKTDANHSLRYSMEAAFSLALAVGAKLYPVVLAPLFFLTIAKQTGWKAGLLSSVVFTAITGLVLCPMYPTGSAVPASFDESSLRGRSDDRPPLPPAEVSTAVRDPSESLRAFLGRWEMNDFLFLLVIENLRPTDGLPQHQIPWFTVIPASWRASLVDELAIRTGLPAERVPFLLARAILSVLFIALACGLARWAAAAESRTAEPGIRVLEAAFLTLAWFWLMLPTQNPWYLLWCLPLLPFARSRAWIALSGLAFVYYLRFWLTAQFTEPVFGTPYPGAAFFDYIITWIEFAPWLCWLALDWAICHRRREGSPQHDYQIGV